MSRHVAIVTDSTAYLPPRTMERHGITASRQLRRHLSNRFHLCLEIRDSLDAAA